MNFSVERPMALYGLLLIIPPMLYSALTYKKT